MDHPTPPDDNALIAGETAPVPMASADNLSQAVVKMRAVELILVTEPLIAAYQAASSPHTRFADPRSNPIPADWSIAMSDKEFGRVAVLKAEN